MGRFAKDCTRCGVWGVAILILVCVGASEYKMDRMLRAIDELCDEGVIKGNEVIAQIGYTDYKPRNYKYFNLIDRNEFQTYMEQADLIISHAGTGSVIPPLKLGKKVIVFPRLEKYSEHLDNHQLELCDVFTNGGYTMRAENKDELREQILKAGSFVPKKFASNNIKINQMICDYIDSI